MVKTITSIELKNIEPYILGLLQHTASPDVEYLDAWVWFPPNNLQTIVLINNYPRIANLYISKSVNNIHTLSTVRISIAGDYEFVKNSQYSFILAEHLGIQTWLNTLTL